MSHTPAYIAPHIDCTGADPEVEEGGGGRAHIQWGWCGHAERAARGIFSLRTHNAQRSRRVWGHEFRPYESASETVGDHHNHAKCLTTGL